jgi:hypothetical protein
MLRTSTPFASATVSDIVGAKPVVDLSDVNSSSLIAAANDGHTTGRFLMSAPPTDTYFVGINEYLAAGLSLLWNERTIFRDDPRLQMSNNNNRTGTWYKNLAAR